MISHRPLFFSFDTSSFHRRKRRICSRAALLILKDEEKNVFLVGIKLRKCARKVEDEQFKVFI